MCVNVIRVCVYLQNWSHCRSHCVNIELQPCSIQYQGQGHCHQHTLQANLRQGVVFDVRACSGTLEHAPQPGKRRRYIFHREAQEDLTARAMPTNFRKLKRRKYMVTASTRALVKGCQPDERRASTRPVREEATVYDPKTSGLLMHYTKEDQELNVRAFVTDTIEVTKCHEDAQVEEGRGNVMRYVASYDAKFSGSFAQEWQCNEPSAYSVARRILFDYHPLEPEMWLTIAGRLFPQMTTGGNIKILSIPWATKDQKPAHVTNYENCRWRREDMKLLEWLRKTNNDGAINRWVKLRYQREVFERCYAAHVTAGDTVSLRRFWESKKAGFKKYVASIGKHTDDELTDAEDVMSVEQWMQMPVKLEGTKEHPDMYSSLEAFANAVECQGEKLIAATPYSMLSDRYYGQWLTLNVPFRNMSDFCVPEVMERVPERYVNFALALHHKPKFWSDPEEIDKDMKLHAHRDAHIKSVKDKVRAHAHTVGRYLSGELDKDVDVPSEDEAGPSPEGIVTRTHAQRRAQHPRRRGPPRSRAPARSRRRGISSRRRRRCRRALASPLASHQLLSPGQPPVSPACPRRRPVPGP